MNPNKDIHDLKPEELHSIKYLENLGITKDHLIYSNLKENNNGELSDNSSSMFTPANPQSHYMNNLINAKTNAQFSEKNVAANLKFSYELKQSINGTYRIVFHMIQKKMLNEYNSEQMKAKKEEIFKNNSLDVDKSLKVDNNNNVRRQSVNLHRNQTDYDDNDEVSIENSILVSTFKKQNLNNNNNTNHINSNGNKDENKSIFVRLNSNTHSNSKLNISKKNIINGTNGTDGNLSPKETLFQKNRSRLNSSTSNNVQAKRRLSQDKDFKQYNASSIQPQNIKQSSKLCSIL